MTQTNPYLDIVQQGDIQAMRQSLLSSVDQNPDTEAGLQDLAGQTGLPVDAVRLNQPEALRRARLDAVPYADIARHMPATTALLSNPQHAALAQDDVGNLTAMEQALRFGKRSGQALLSGIYGFSEGVAGQAEAGSDLLRKYVTGPLADAGVLPVDIGGPVAAALHGIRQQQTAWRNYLMPRGESNLEAGYYAGLQSLTQNLLTVPLALSSGNPNLALSTMALNTGGQSYGRARDAGVSAERALLYGAGDAAVEYATESLPLNLLLKDVKVGSGFFQSLTRQLASEIPGEQAATALQDLNEWAVLHPEQTWADYVKARPDAALQTLVATAVGGGAQVGVMHGVQALLDRDARRLTGAEQGADWLQDLTDLAQASKLLPRSPALYRAFVAKALAENPEDALYMDARAFADSGVAEPVMAMLPQLAEQLPEALASGGDIRLPLADYAARLAPTRFAAPLLAHWRLPGQVFSKAQAQAYQSQQAPAIQTEVAQLLQHQQQAQAHQASAQRVGDAISAELDKLGRHSPAVNRLYADLHRAFFATQGQRLGLSPEQLYADSGLNFQSSQPGEDSPYRGQFDPHTRSIKLLDKADLSTFLHESGHFFLEMQLELAARLRAQQQAETAGVFHQPAEPAYLFNDKAPSGDYAARTRMVVSGHQRLGTDIVTTPGQAAMAMHYLRHSAVERVVGLLTDKRGKPLAIIGNFKGSVTEAPLFSLTLASEAFRVKKAANLWIAHNHPGGELSFSRQDWTMLQHLQETFRGSKIKLHGLLVFTGRQGEGHPWVFEPAEAAEGATVLGFVADGFSAENGVEAPVLDRELHEEGNLDWRQKLPLSAAHLHGLTHGRSGILLLDAQDRPLAYLPVKKLGSTLTLRTRGRLDGLYRALSITNAANVVLVNYSDMTASATFNLAGFFNHLGFHLQDIWDVRGDTLSSRLAHGMVYRVYHNFKQSPPNEDVGFTPQRQAALSAPLAAGSARQQFLQDTQTLLHWFGVDSLAAWQKLNFAEKSRYHEQFAEAFEAYLASGKAPTAALQSMFQRFRAWLLEVYRHLRGHEDLHPAVRAVFDRMLASDAEIRAAQPAQFADAQQAGMSPAEFAEYQALQAAAHHEALDGVRPDNAQAAQSAMHGGRREQLLAAEADALAKAGGETRFFADTLGHYTRSRLNRWKLADIHPEQFLAAEARAGSAATQALQAGDLQTAAQQKHRQLQHFHAAREAMAVHDKLQAMLSGLIGRNRR